MVLTNASFFYFNKSNGEYKPIERPEFYKLTPTGRQPLTLQDIHNNTIQPYDRYDYELIIKPITKRPGDYSVRRVQSNIIMNNNNNNKNIVTVNNILSNYPGNLNEQIAKIKLKYKHEKSEPYESISYISHRQQVFEDLTFLFNYFIKLKEFYTSQIIEKKGQNVLNRALRNNISYLNVFSNSDQAITNFDNTFAEEMKVLPYVARRYKVLQLSKPSVFSNPNLLYKKILELQNDFNNYYTMLNQYQSQSKKTFENINTRLKNIIKSRKRDRENNNNNDYVPPKKFTLGLPPRGGRRKTRKL